MPTPKLQKGKLPPSAQAARRAPAGSVDGSAAGSQHGTSAYEIMASRIANRIAEMAESLTVVERPS